MNCLNCHYEFDELDSDHIPAAGHLQCPQCGHLHVAKRQPQEAINEE